VVVSVVMSALRYTFGVRFSYGARVAISG